MLVDPRVYLVSKVVTLETKFLQTFPVVEPSKIPHLDLLAQSLAST